MTSMGELRRRASIVRRMGLRMSRLVAEFEGNSDAVLEAAKERYGSWAVWLQIALQLLPILIELFKALQKDGREDKFATLSRQTVASMSMDVMHAPEAIDHISEDYREAGMEHHAMFLDKVAAVYRDGVIEEPQGEGDLS